MSRMSRRTLLGNALLSTGAECVVLVSADLNAGFLPRLAFLFATAWYIGSVGRWVVPMNDLYIEVGHMPGMTLALALLIIAPLGLMLVSITGPTAHAWRRYRRGKD